jgi:predicted permease
MNNNKKKLLMPAFAIFLMIMSYSRLTGSECIRPIHFVTLLVLGAAIGILLVNIINLIKEKKIN